MSNITTVKLSFLARSSDSIRAFRNIRRRQGWLLENVTPRKLLNLFIAGIQFVLKREVMRAWPVIVKVDISPLCNLQCTVCVHASPASSGSEDLKGQRFKADQKMSLAQFKRITDEVSGKSMAISLYYLGDPLVHPDLDAMCRMARDAKLNSHVSTNFSFNLSDERIRSIVQSGLTHLTVCVDGLSQDKYERTRVGGRLPVVLDNLERLLQCRRQLKQKYPKVEVQYIKFQHNVDELEGALAYFAKLGVDQVTDYWGELHNYTDLNPGKYEVFRPKKRKRLPQCLWPHFSIQLKYNGEVIPCCNYRQGLQYNPKADSRVVGNVFTSSLWSVWNSPAYQSLRRFVSNPERVATEPGLTKTFCDGCPSLFDTDFKSKIFVGSQHRWEDRYQLDDRKRVIPKAVTNA